MMMRALFLLNDFMLLAMAILEAFYFLIRGMFFMLAVEAKSQKISLPFLQIKVF